MTSPFNSMHIFLYIAPNTHLHIFSIIFNFTEKTHQIVIIPIPTQKNFLTIIIFKTYLHIFFFMSFHGKNSSKHSWMVIFCANCLAVKSDISILRISAIAYFNDGGSSKTAKIVSSMFLMRSF